MATYYISGVTTVIQNSAAMVNKGSGNPSVVNVAGSREILPTGNYPVIAKDVTVADINHSISRTHNRNISQRSPDALPLGSSLLNGSIYPQYLNSINYKESARTARKSTAIRNGKYNMFNGKFEPGYPATGNDTFGNDNAARSSYNNPGSLYFRVGKNITTHNYSPKG